MPKIWWRGNAILKFSLPHFSNFLSPAHFWHHSLFAAEICNLPSKQYLAQDFLFSTFSFDLFFLLISLFLSFYSLSISLRSLVIYRRIQNKSYFIILWSISVSNILALCAVLIQKSLIFRDIWLSICSIQAWQRWTKIWLYSRYWI